jgi:hypothetical protein
MNPTSNNVSLCFDDDPAEAESNSVDAADTVGIVIKNHSNLVLDAKDLLNAGQIR